MSSSPNIVIGRSVEGAIAWPAIWNAALTDAEVLQLAQGADPRTIRPQNLVAFWPLDTPGTSIEYEWKRRYDLTVTGATPAADPFSLPSAKSPFAKRIFSFGPSTSTGNRRRRLIAAGII